MPLVQAVYNVQTQPVHAPAILDIRVQNVTLHVVVIQLDQAAQSAIRLRVNVLAILDTQEPHATLVTLTIIEQVMELAQVQRIIFLMHTLKRFKY